MAQQQVEARKKEVEQSLAQVQSPLKSIIEDMERDLKLNQNFFLCDNVDHEENVIYNQKIIPKKTI